MAWGARYSEWRSGLPATGYARAFPALRIAALMAACAARLLPLASTPVMAQARLAIGMRAPIAIPVGHSVDPDSAEVSHGTQVTESKPGSANSPAVLAIASGMAVSEASVPATADAVIEQMSEAAGVIFAGQVIAVRRPTGFVGSAQDAAEGVVEIDFQVVRAVRGPRQGSVYTMREWSGLWVGSAERFHVGKQLLVFLRIPDASGLSSPVHGSDGAIPLRGGGISPGPDDTTVAAAEWLVDLRWVQTRALQQQNWKTMPVREPAGRGGPQPSRSYGSEDQSVLVPAIPGQDRVAASSTGETESLSQVLQLCVNSMRKPHATVR